MSVAVVILNWNGRKFFELFLPQVILNTSSDAKIIIADNCSSDNSLEFVRINYPNIEIIENDKNYGFAEGYNKALAHVFADYYILLNSDIETTEGWVIPLIAFMNENKDVAACQPKIKSYYNKEWFEYAGAAGGFIDKYGFPFCRGRIFDTLEKDEGQYDCNAEIFWATGACLCVRSDLFWSVGGFDKDFFAHMEEIDLCWRLKRKGYKIYYICNSEVYHVGGGTLPKKNPNKTFLNFRNSLYILLKNTSSLNLLYIIPVKFILDVAAAVKFLFSSGFRDLLAIMRAHFYCYVNIFKILKKRRQLKKYEVDLLLNKSIVIEYYVKCNKYFKDIKF
ncbi:MAG: glycosyl transferase family 2 [Bacteroidetes bacterium GWE2_29_8]|nr:MAG: glycosyl transferase family 2 [Bacteroidetes bacterium GWE2_29_8]OFY15355.1 MAG: glycosyl transferase family 2 [Bacteroidetes bacterium GWF2_29_10]